MGCANSTEIFVDIDALGPCLCLTLARHGHEELFSRIKFPNLPQLKETLRSIRAAVDRAFLQFADEDSAPCEVSGEEELSDGSAAPFSLELLDERTVRATIHVHRDIEGPAEFTVRFPDLPEALSFLNSGAHEFSAAAAQLERCRAIERSKLLSS